MQIPRIWRFGETHMTRTPHHSKTKKSAVHGLPLTQVAVGGFFTIWYVRIGNDYEFTWNRDGCQDAYTDDIESGEWKRENGRFMEFEPLSSKTVRHIRFYIKVPKQIEKIRIKDCLLYLL